jgi:hypothetical protein
MSREQAFGSVRRRAPQQVQSCQWHVTYYYLATGMEGNADTRDLGGFTATSAEDAIEQAAFQMCRGDPSAKEFVKGCLTARRCA